MHQMGEAHGKYIHDYSAGLRDFLCNYLDMRNFNTIDVDKYFHYKANCEATKQGQGGKGAACDVSNTREKFDQNVKRDPASASAADRQTKLPTSSVAVTLAQEPAAKYVLCTAHRAWGRSTSMRKAMQVAVVLIIFLVVIMVGFWIKRQLSIDSCLDEGGKWNYSLSSCDR